jgi:hypothetical protein
MIECALRLMRHCIRHAFDPCTEDMSNNCGRTLRTWDRLQSSGAINGGLLRYCNSPRNVMDQRTPCRQALAALPALPGSAVPFATESAIHEPVCRSELLWVFCHLLDNSVPRVRSSQEKRVCSRSVCAIGQRAFVVCPPMTRRWPPWVAQTLAKRDWLVFHEPRPTWSEPLYPDSPRNVLPFCAPILPRCK